MTHEEKINYMRIAASLCNYGFNNEQLDLFVSIYEEIIRKEGESDIKTILKIESQVKSRYQVLENKKPVE